MFPPLIQHRRVVGQGDEPGDAVPRPQSITARCPTRTEQQIHVLADPTLAATEESVDVESSQNGDTIAVQLLSLGDGQNGIFKGVLGIYTNHLDELIHDGRELAARVKDAGLAFPVDYVCQSFVPG